MSILSSKPFVTLNDLIDEPVSTTLGSFNYLASSYGLEPFKLVTFKNSVLISRFKIADVPNRSQYGNYFLSILLVKTSISLEDVNDFVIDLASSKKLSHAALNIYKNVLLTDAKDGSNTGKEWAFKQARLGMRLLLSLGQDADIEITVIDNFDREIFSNILDLDENKWTIFSAFMLRAKIKRIPKTLLNSSFGLN
jgi:hypothetical protein